MLISRRVALDMYRSYDTIRIYCHQHFDGDSATFERYFCKSRGSAFLQRLVVMYLNGPGQQFWQVITAKYRVGRFGWLVFPDLVSERRRHKSAQSLLPI